MMHGTYYDASNDTLSVIAGWLVALVVWVLVVLGTAWALRFATVRTVVALGAGTMFAMVAYGVGTDFVYAARMARLDRKATEEMSSGKEDKRRE